MFSAVTVAVLSVLSASVAADRAVVSSTVVVKSYVFVVVS